MILCMNLPRRRGFVVVTIKAALLPLAFPETSIYNDINSYESSAFKLAYGL